MQEQEETLRRIHEFRQWHYQFELDGHLTPIFDEGHINRHRERKSHFFDPLVRMLGGSLRGKRVLDLGCNAGFWSLCAIEAGCDFVLGIDGRAMHIEQAKLVFECKEVDPSRFTFLESNVFDLDYEALGTFDVVLCLGLLYHVNRPIELMQSIATVAKDLVVIDTTVCKQEGGWFRLLREDTSEPRMSVDYDLVFVPSTLAVAEIAKLFGFECVVLEPAFDDYTGAEDFRDGTRRAFVCSKISDLSKLPALTEQPI